MSLLAGASTTATLGRPFSYPNQMRPFSFTGWVRFTAIPNIFGMGFANLSGASQYAGLLWHVDNTTALAAVADEKDSAGTEGYTFADYGGANTVAAPLVQWYFGAAVFTGLSYRWSTIFRAGDLIQRAAVSSTTTVVASPYTHLTVGSVQPSVGNLSSNSGTYLAECALWGAELGYADVLALAQGANPLTVGPHAKLLRDYGSLEYGLQDLGTAAYARTYGDHPTVMPAPRGRQFFVAKPAVATPTRRPIMSISC